MNKRALSAYVSCALKVVGIVILNERYIQNQFERAKQVLARAPSRIEKFREMHEKGEISASRLKRIEQILSQLTGDDDAIKRQDDRAISQIRDRCPEAENPAKTNILKSGLRVGFESLLLAIGYIIIGGTGLGGFTRSASLPLS